MRTNKRGEQYGFPIAPSADDLTLAKKWVDAAKPERVDNLRQSLPDQTRRTFHRRASESHIHRLILRPMVGHHHDADITERLVNIVATIIAAANGHVRITKQDESYSAFVMFFGDHAFRRCMIAWLAHHASKNHWSLIEDYVDPE